MTSASAFKIWRKERSIRRWSSRSWSRFGIGRLNLPHAFGVESDALATLNPDELERIARAAVAPYFDAGLQRRVEVAEAAWRRRVAEEIAGQVDEDRLDRLKERAEDGLDILRSVNAELADMVASLETIEPPDLPEADMVALAGAQAENYDAVLVDSDMSFEVAVDRLKAHSERGGR